MSSCDFSSIAPSQSILLVCTLLLAGAVYMLLSRMSSFNLGSYASLMSGSSKTQLSTNRIADMVYLGDKVEYDDIQSVLSGVVKKTTDPYIRGKPRKAWLLQS